MTPDRRPTPQIVMELLGNILDAAVEFVATEEDAQDIAEQTVLVFAERLRSRTVIPGSGWN